MKWIGLLILVCLGLEAKAQKFPSEFWHEGKIIREGGDTLTGSVKYDLQNDVVQFSNGEKLDSYTARKLTFFEIFDVTSKHYRQFYSIPYAASGGYKAPIFFELLAEGKMTLLCRESIEYRNSNSSFYSYGTSTRLVLVYHYYLLNENGANEPFNGKRADLILLMGNKGAVVEKYIKTNKLNLDDRNEFTEIIRYYNSL